MFIRTILLALLSSGAAAANLRSGPCDESFPLAPPTRRVTSNNGRAKRHDRRLVANPPGDDSGEYYETGEYYAPLCPDRRRIDIRKLARCTGEQCYDENIGFCVYTCSWLGSGVDSPTPPPNPPTPLPNPPTLPPTPAPTPKPMFQPEVIMFEPEVTFQPEVTEHPLLISLRNLPKQYRMNKEIRDAIIRYMRDKLKHDLAEMGLGLELLELSYPGRLPGNPHALPLNVKVEGPSEISSFALSYIIQVMKDSNQEMVIQLKKLDETAGGTAFKDLQLSIETYDVDDISVKATNPPSKSPTPAAEPVKTKTSVVAMDAEEAIAEEVMTFPGWEWLIVALVILCVCIWCGCYYILPTEGYADKGQENSVFMQNHTPAKYRRRDKPSQQAIAVYKTTKKSQRPPRSIPNKKEDMNDQGYSYNERIFPEPERLTSDEMQVKKKKRRRKKTKKTKKSDSSRAQIDFDANDSDDTPSVLTRYDDGREEQEHHGGAPSNPYYRNDDEGGHSPSRP